MGIGNVAVLSQVTALTLSFIISFFIFIPLAVNQDEFNGHCLLYTTGVWSNTSDGVQLVDIHWGLGSNCGFIIFMGIIVMMLSLFYIVLYSCYLIRDSDSSWLEAFLSAVVFCVITVLLFTSTLILTVGFNKWCDLITDPISFIVSCSVADFINFHKQITYIDSNNFYTEMKMAEFGAWSCTLCWMFLSVMASIKLYRFQQHETFMTSVSRERERLLQKVGHRSDYSV